ncbi:MAG: cupin domain-containing protein [Gammaproteobacteria bacterium]|nr:cupin domain-containing protein [Gammaproteobacteria bacterium]
MPENAVAPDLRREEHTIVNPLIEAPLPDCHANRRRQARVDTTLLNWEASPSGTVWRKPLYRVGGENGPVTSLVRYAPGGAFQPHSHPDGEEILVLEGVFADEHGDYPAGTYLLNPDGSRHAPRSDPGCVLLVRLRQYPGAHRLQQVLDTTTGPWSPGLASGIEMQMLYAQAGYPERMRLERWCPDTTRSCHPNGEEIFILEGALQDGEGAAGPGCWLRYPPGDCGVLHSIIGCQLYVRVGG